MQTTLLQPQLSSPTGTLIEKTRISSIDVMRGVVMVVMALDHTRDFFHRDANVFDPTDLSQTSPVLFFTRWITHFCAPTFVMLSGVSIRINQQFKTKKALSTFLLSRGLWLILLEVTIVRFSIMFNLYYDEFCMLQVIWAIGASMIAMAALIHLPFKWVAVLGVAIVFLHNTLDAVQLQVGDPFFVIWTLLHQSTAYPTTTGLFLITAYPMLPWLGVMLVGYAIGHMYTEGFSSAMRKKNLIRFGVGAILIFIVLRFLNVYGDPSRWSPQENWVFSVMSFLNCTKYPPSLLYILMTLGPVLLILAALEKTRVNAHHPLLVFGRVPLFYYIIHFYLIHATGLFRYMIDEGVSFGELNFHIDTTFGEIPFGEGVTLPWVYVAWICIVTALYPLCRWYNNYKKRNKHWALSYL